MTPLLFGKLPTHGDFVSRGLAPEAVDRLDAWAADGLEAAKSRLGEGFETAHGFAPPWRFVQEEADGWRAGVFAPSADTAGRRFFLLLGAQGLSAVEAGVLGANLAEHLEATLYSAFAEEMNADLLFTRIGQVVAEVSLSAPAAALIGAPASASVWWTLGGERHEADATASPGADLIVRMLTPALAGSGEEAA